MSVSSATPPKRWSGNVLLLVLVGAAAVVGGYWLSAQLASGDVTATSSANAAGPSSTEESNSHAGGSQHNVPRTREKTEAADGVRFPSTTARPDSLDLYGPLWRLAWATLAVLGLALVFVWLARRWFTQHTSSQAADQTMKVAAELHLGARCRVVLVHVGQEQVIVGMDNRGISAIAPLPPRFQDFLDELPRNQESSRPRNGALLAAMVGDGDVSHGS